MSIDSIIDEIQLSENIDTANSFRYCKECSKLLRNKETVYDGRRIVIYILENWSKLDPVTYEIWTDIVESQGFYPYLDKDEEKFTLKHTAGELRKEMSRSKNLPYYLHDEQLEVKNLLDGKQNVIVSAPTSFGKSLLIEELVAEGKYKNILIIQPTLALLDETRKKLKKYYDKYSIIVRTSQEPSNEKGNLFLLTAERVMEYHELPKIDLLIIDEFYKLSATRDDERSDVLNNAFHLLLKRDKVKFYLLGPNIDGISEGFAEKYNAIFFKTDYSLVEQEVIDMHSSDFGASGQKKMNKEEALFSLLLSLKDEQNIIYCSSPARARYLSNAFLGFSKINLKPTNKEINLIEWIEKNISKKWTLIDCLKFGIAYHDGALQKHISSSVVKYFNEKKITFLFCTSTIIEGVNTSAKNIIIFDKHKGRNINKNIIDYFDYSNIKGRAGRMMIHYIGKVYNFNPPIAKLENMIVDIPFFQQSPIKDEVLIHLDSNEVIDKTTEQYKKINQINNKEKQLFKKNGVLVDGQKIILDILRKDIDSKRKLIVWTGYPNWEELEYIFSLGWNYLLKSTETTYPMTLKKLTKLTLDYGIKQDIHYLIKSNVKFFETQAKYANSTKSEILDEAIRDAFNILRHWFQYKIPKILRTVHSLQEFVCEEKGIKSGNYSYYADRIESDFIRDNLSILLEYGIPKSAIKKIEEYIQKDINEDEVIRIVKSKKFLKKINFLEYEKEKIMDSL